MLGNLKGLNSNPYCRPWSSKEHGDSWKYVLEDYWIVISLTFTRLQSSPTISSREGECQDYENDTIPKQQQQLKQKTED